MVRRVLIILSIFILLPLGLLGTVVVFPSLVFNTNVLKFLNKSFFTELSVQWDKLSTDVEYKGVLTRELELDGRDFCVSYAGSRACFENASVAVTFSPNLGRFIKISRPHVQDRSIVIQLNEQEEEEALDLKVAAESAQSWIERLKSIWPAKDASIRINLNATRVETSDDMYYFHLMLNNQSVKLHLSGHDSNLEIDLAGENPELLSGELTLDSDIFSAKGRVELKLESGTEVRFSPAFKILRPVAASGSGEFAVEINRRELTMRIHDVKAEFKQYLRNLSVERCEWILVFDNGGDDGEENDWSTIECPANRMQATNRHFGLVQKTFPRPFTVTLNFSVDAQLNIRPTEAKEILQVNVGGANDWREKWAFDIDLSAILLRGPDRTLSVEPRQLEWSLEIPEFENVIDALSETKFAVPAPFASLKGGVKAKNDGQVVLQPKHIEIPFSIRADLDHAKENQVALSLDGVLIRGRRPNSQSHVRADVALDKFYVYLPKIDPIHGLPRLRSDHRIRKTLKESLAEAKDPRFQFDVSVNTNRPDSIRVFYYLTEPYVAGGVQVDWQKSIAFDARKSAGDVVIEYLGRKVVFKNMSVKKRRDSTDIPVDGLFVYEAAGYKINLAVVGTAAQPHLLLTSEPPLDRDDIVSLILYNKKARELTSFQEESVGGAQAAIADRALGLLGIWAFASTPIESVRYNPATKNYSAQISLPGGVHASIGTDWESVNELSFRKRLTRTWFIETTYHPGDVGERKGDVMLQKEIPVR